MQLGCVNIDNRAGDAIGTTSGKTGGTTGAVPVVFLHGFGGLARQWWGLQTQISFKAPTFAFDMPGHGESLDFPDFGPPKIAARALIAEFDQRGINKAHIVGHSMGGAIASILSLLAPERIASLTLLAPGGYGEEFNHPLLLQWAAATTRDELRTVMGAFFGPAYNLPQKVVDFQYEARQRPGAVDALVQIANGMSSNGRQGVLPIDDVLDIDVPKILIWGREDRVLPVNQADAFHGKAEIHLIDGVGHSPAEEAPKTVLQAILSQL